MQRDLAGEQGEQQRAKRERQGPLIDAGRGAGECEARGLGARVAERERMRLLTRQRDYENNAEDGSAHGLPELREELPPRGGRADLMGRDGVLDGQREQREHRAHAAPEDEGVQAYTPERG